MLTTLITVIQAKSRREELKHFLMEIQSTGISVMEIEPEQMHRLSGEKSSRQPFVRQDSLLLTDMPQAAEKARLAGMAVLGIEWESGQRIPHAAYVVQGLLELDRAYLQMVYRRAHRLPLCIAETRRLYIRELCVEEAELFWQLAREAGLTVKDMPANPSGEELEEFMRAYIRYQYEFFGYGVWGLVEKKSGNLIGIAGIEDREMGGESYLELGYAVVPERRRQGYAKEACTAILSYAQRELEYRGKIKCFVPEENVASHYTAQSIGMLQTKDIFDILCCYERML